MSVKKIVISVFMALIFIFILNISLNAHAEDPANASKTVKAGQNKGKTAQKRHKDSKITSKKAKNIRKNTTKRTQKVRPEDKYKDLTLKKLFPEKSFWGPSARSMAFSADGKYGAYLYRPYKERRHGYDIYVYDIRTGKIKRLTSVSVMAEFQQNTRKVKDDRIKKAEKILSKSSDSRAKTAKEPLAKTQKGNNNPGTGTKKDSEKQLMKNGDWVSDKDADDKKAPKYSGISSFQWAPVGHKLLFISRGDVYLYNFDKDDISRLTRTSQTESDIRWLSDASGFTYMADGNLYRMLLKSNVVEQINPQFSAGQRMTGYKISPDGDKIVFVTTKYGQPSKPPHRVNIATYRDRFMRTNTYSRQVAEDPSGPKHIYVYIFRVMDLFKEETSLTEIFQQTFTMPRDYISTPQWSLDSLRVTFAVYQQSNSEVKILESKCAKSDKQSGEKTAQSKVSKAVGKVNRKTPQKNKSNNGGSSTKAKFEHAVVVHRFLHTGGPTTPFMIKPQYMYDNQRIVYLSEETGFRHLHILDPLYQSTVSLTIGRFEVYPVKISQDHRWMLVISTREQPFREEVYRLDLETGKLDRLSIKPGRYTRAAISPDGKMVLANFVRYGQPQVLVFINTTKKIQKTLADSNPPLAWKLTKPRPTFFNYKNRNGQDIYGQMFKPDDWKRTDKRPLLIYLYGGPLGKQKQVLEGYYQSSCYFFAYYMAKKHGWVTCTIDPRGNSGYGGLFERSNFEQVGKPQVEDVVDAVKYFVKNEGVDPKRVALHGWSFGGFQTQMCLYTKPDVFAAGIAGAGPTEWQNYNAWYTTSTIALPNDVRKFSLIPLAKNLKAKLLLMHGLEDNNVLFQDTIKIYRELLRQHKETLVELFIDPTGKHGLGGDVKTLGRFRKYEEFLLRTVGEDKSDGNR